MFFLTYLRRELRSRMRQAVVVACGLAVGIGLVVTVTAASAGVRTAQASVLRSLYGVGTDLTVTKNLPAVSPGKPPPGGGQTLQIGPGGAQTCSDGKCHPAGGQTIDTLAPSGGLLDSAAVGRIGRLAGVASAAGGLTFTDNQVTLPKNFGQAPPPQPKSFTADGVDLAHRSLGPLSDAQVTSGRSLTAADADSYVAEVDSGYARAHQLKVGGSLSIGKHRFTIAGIVAQPQGASPPDAYIPLARAQALDEGPGNTTAKNKVDAVYVAAASASDVPAVQREIARLLPHATVTSSANLASEVTGSMASTARLADVLGRWLSVLVLVAAFVLASLLTLGAVARRTREFGTLKALGWRTGRIVAQVMGESVFLGVIGGAVGVGIGYAGAAIITAIAPRLSATVATPTGQHMMMMGPGGSQSSSPTVSHTVAVPLTAPVGLTALGVAVALAIVGGLVAGMAGSWRIAQLRPAAALAKVD